MLQMNADLLIAICKWPDSSLAGLCRMQMAKIKELCDT